jgi:NAD(P)-dependent dehydrogenase (short-subunit alcohol dehydrogenase family)
MTKNRWTEADIPDQTGRVAIVTGSNTGLGLHTARALAEHGAHVILAVRNLDKGAAAAETIRKFAPEATVDVQELDLSSLESVRKAAAELRAAHQRIDVLINNAGIMTPPKTVTPDGFELQFGTNHLGHFALTGLLLPSMLEVEGSRVVVVASLDHKIGGAIHFDDLQWERRYVKALAYAQSKIANIMFGYELDRRLRKAGVPTISVSAHPGVTDSDLFRNVSFLLRPIFQWSTKLFAQSPEKGALPQLYAATAPGVEGGQYWGPDGIGEMLGYPTLVKASRKANDRDVQKRLWAVSEELTGVTFPV